MNDGQVTSENPAFARVPHYHYSWPHGRACERTDCPPWLRYCLPDGRCDDPLCECQSMRGEPE